MSEIAVVWGIASAMFLIGFAGMVARRQLLALLLCLELMVNAANLPLAYYARYWGAADAVAAIFLILAVAACEAVVGLSLILALYRKEDAIETDQIAELEG
jgi:NADH-quinone oxidoreductase subunit K